MINREGWKITYTISQYSHQEKLLQIDMKLSNISRDDTISFYKGKIKLSKLKSSQPFNEDKNFVYIKPQHTSELIISYTASIGALGKHGHLGIIDKDMITFAGEQILLMPLDALSLHQEEDKVCISNITMDLNFPERWTAVYPFSTADIEKFTPKSSSVNFPSWSDVYNLMKSCYAFGSLRRLNNLLMNELFSIYADTGSNSEIDEEVLKGIYSLYVYFADIFERDMPPLSFVILRKSKQNEMYIAGGSGKQTIGATFEPNNPRDWQLLAHRMFHSFMDAAITIADTHLPPNLWLTEGLAVYYETMALENLPQKLRYKLKIDTTKTFQNLFKRYVYMKLKDPILFSIIPMNESNIRSAGQLEFLHYTLAPLIVKLIEDMNRSKPFQSHLLIKNIIQQGVNYNFRDTLKAALGNELNSFSERYLYQDDLLPLWYLFIGAKENREEVVDVLKDFEYILWTWFLTENSQYPMYNISDVELSLLPLMENGKQVHFAPDAIEEKVLRMSPTVYALLKIYKLRAEVCGIQFSDLELKFKLLKIPENITKWHTYLEQIRTF